MRMKKTTLLGLFIAVIAILVASCGSSETPTDAALRFAGYLEKGEYATYAEQVVVPESSSKEEWKKQKEILVSVLKEREDEKIVLKGGVRKTEILSAIALPDRAKVYLLRTFTNGDKEDFSISLIKQGEKWKIDLKEE